MSQAELLVDVLKQALRRRGVTYVAVAKALKLSESSVKRMFSRRHLSLARLEQVCGMIELEIPDLLELTRAAEGRISELSEEQEQELVGDPRLLLVGTLAISHWSAAKILETYRFTESDLVRILARLDRLGIIDLLPGNRIRVRLQRNFNWRKRGPIQRFFEERVQQQFFESSFLRKGELRLSVHGSISDRSNGVLQQRLRKIAEEFDLLVEEDKQLAHEMREGTSLVMAIRPWELGLFAELRRSEEAKASGKSLEAPMRPERRRK